MIIVVGGGTRENGEEKLLLTRRKGNVPRSRGVAEGGNRDQRFRKSEENSRKEGDLS